MSLVATESEARLAQRVPHFIPQMGTGLVSSHNLVSCERFVVTIQMDFGGELARSSGLEPQRWLLREQHALEPAAVTSIPDMLIFIRTAFGVNIKQLAQILQVTRVTVYDWMKDDGPINLQEDKRRRLHHIYAVARFWQRLPAIPGNYLQDRIEMFNATLEQLLQGDTVNQIHLLAAHGELLSAVGHTERREATLRRQRRALETAEQAILANATALGVIID